MIALTIVEQFNDARAKARAAQVIVEQVATHVTIRKAAEVTGYSERAIEEKIAKGVWLKGREWTHAPDGRRLIIMKGYQQWVEQGKA